MCTVSWLREPAATGAGAAGGYRLWFNRDERKGRAPEHPAREHERDGVRFLAPVDGESRGTWIALNEFGLCVALLNGYVARRGSAPASVRSRGRLVLDRAGHREVAELGRALAATDLAPYEPFVLLGVAPGDEARTWRWDGATLAERAGDRELCPLASSGVVQAEAQRSRAALFRRMTTTGLTAEALEAFQRSHEEGPDALTPCMHREDAETRSQVRARVTAEAVELVHVPGPPCRTAPDPALRLARRRLQGHAPQGPAQLDADSFGG